MFNRVPIFFILTAILAASCVNCQEEEKNYDDIYKIPEPNHEAFYAFQNKLTAHLLHSPSGKYNVHSIRSLENTCNEFKQMCVDEFAKKENATSQDAFDVLDFVVNTLKMKYVSRIGGKRSERIKIFETLRHIFKRDPLNFFRRLKVKVEDLDYEINHCRGIFRETFDQAVMRIYILDVSDREFVRLGDEDEKDSISGDLIGSPSMSPMHPLCRTPSIGSSAGGSPGMSPVMSPMHPLFLGSPASSTYSSPGHPSFRSPMHPSFKAPIRKKNPVVTFFQKIKP